MPNTRWAQSASPVLAGVLLAAIMGPGCGGNGDDPTPAPDAGVTPSEDGGEETLDASFNPDQVERGRRLYSTLRCANCHGASGEGSSTFPGAPTLIGRTAEDLITAITIPCADLTSNCHPLKLPDLNQQFLEDIAVYLTWLEGQTPREENAGPPCDNVPGNICTIMGNGLSGHIRQEGLLARKQRMFWPQNVEIDPQGRVIATDWNNYIFKRIEPAGCMDFTDAQGRMGRDCPLSHPIGTSGLGDTCSRQGLDAGKMVPAKSATMNHPVGIVYFRQQGPNDTTFPNVQGDMLLWGWHQWKIKYIPVDPATPDVYGEMFCIWGNGRGFHNDVTNGPVPAGTGRTPAINFFNLPSSSVWDRNGNFYISDQGNLRIRIVPRDATDMDVRGEAFASSRRDNLMYTWAGGEPVDAERGHHRCAAETSSTSAIDGQRADCGDGQAVSSTTTAFRLQFGFDAIPQMRMAFDRERNFLYIADAENGRIRRVDFNRPRPCSGPLRTVSGVTCPIIETYAGCAGTGAPEDLPNCSVTASNAPATQARLFRPGDVDVIPDGSGDIVITDAFNHCVRVVELATRKIYTVAGQCGEENYGYEGDGGPGTQAKLAEPGGTTADSARNIYIADVINHRIRKVNAAPLR